MTKDKFVSLGFLLLEVFDCQSNANLTKAQFVFASWFPGLRRTFLLAFGVWFYAVVYVPCKYFPQARRLPGWIKPKATVSWIYGQN